MEYTNISLSDLVKKGRILVRFLGKIGQIVSQIFENFSQILTISTLYDTESLQNIIFTTVDST